MANNNYNAIVRLIVAGYHKIDALAKKELSTAEMQNTIRDILITQEKLGIKKHD